MRRTYVAQGLIWKLSGKVQNQLNLKDTLILGVVLKGLPVAYYLARMNGLVENFVPIVAQRPIQMQHYVESYFPSLDWKVYFQRLLGQCESILILDDVVNTGFTKQRVESIIHSLTGTKSTVCQFAALVLNRKNLANPSFICSNDFFALCVNAKAVDSDWGLFTVPLWDLSIEKARLQCEKYFERFWLDEKRVITITH